MKRITSGALALLLILSLLLPPPPASTCAGILAGSDARGTFHAESNIKRSEVAAILYRMFHPSARQTIKLP